MITITPDAGTTFCNVSGILGGALEIDAAPVAFPVTEPGRLQTLGAAGFLRLIRINRFHHFGLLRRILGEFWCCSLILRRSDAILRSRALTFVGRIIMFVGHGIDMDDWMRFAKEIHDNHIRRNCASDVTSGPAKTVMSNYFQTVALQRTTPESRLEAENRDPEHENDPEYSRKPPNPGHSVNRLSTYWGSYSILWTCPPNST